MHKFELSSKKSRNGKKFFKAVLHEIFPDDCVVDETGTQYNENGITYLEKYTRQHLDSIENMSMTVQFINEERTEIYGHGMTGIEDGMPVFKDATMIGNCTRGYIDDVDIDGEMKKVCIAEGYFDYMRYKDFIDKMQARIAYGEQVVGSVEFSNPEDKADIQYLYGYKDQGRIPVDYDYTGYAILAIRPSDKVASIVEINNNNIEEEQNVMDEKTLQGFISDIKQVISETNSRNDEMSITISELNATISAKDVEITELNEKIKVTEDSLEEKDKKINEQNSSIENLESELSKCKKENAINELNSALENFTKDERKYAEKEIEAFNEDYTKFEVNSIISKINAGIGAKTKESQIAEINAAKNKFKTDDIFGFVDDVTDDEGVIDLTGIFE